ncbi:MAG: DUF4249 family protein [Bacteroidota bacterium]
MRLFIILSAIFLLALAACQEEIALDLPNNDPQVVIEGYLTYWEFQPERNGAEVKITTTGNYYDPNGATPVTDAQVTIRDETSSQEYVLTAPENSAGLYVNNDIPVDLGRSYTLRVDYQNQIYESQGAVLPVAEIDSFSYRFLEDFLFLDDGYYFFFSGRTPKERGINYYRFLVYENDSLFDDPSDIFVQSDEFLNEQVDTLQLANYVFDLGDSVRIEMYSISLEQFTYYNELVELLFNDGGLFSGPPRNPTSTIRNLTNPELPPLGFFQVSSALSGGATVE